jgi:hypothetical protein
VKVFLPRNLYSVASNPHQHNLSSISGNRSAAKHHMLSKKLEIPKEIDAARMFSVHTLPTNET